MYEYKRLNIRESGHTDKVLGQFCTNYKRARYALKDSDLRCLFLLQCQLFEKHDLVETSNEKLKNIQKAILNRNYLLFKYSVVLEF